MIIRGSVVCENIDINNIYKSYYVDSTEADQFATGNGNSVKDLIDAAGGDEITLVFPHSSDNSQTTYTFSTSGTIPNTTHIVLEKGAILNGTTTLTINGGVGAEHWQIFGSGITPDFSGNDKIGAVSPFWFYGGDLGAKINEAWSAGCTNIKLPQGEFSYNTTIAVPSNTEVYYLSGGGMSNSSNAGTTLNFTATDSSNGIEIVNPSGKARGVLKDFRLTGNSNAGNGIKLDNVSRLSKLENLMVQDFTKGDKAGILIESSYSDGFTNIFSIIDCSVKNCDIGLFADAANIFSVWGGTLQGNNKYNLSLRDCRGVSFHGTTIQGCDSSSIGTRIVAKNRSVEALSFIGCWFEEDLSEDVIYCQNTDGYDTKMSFRDCRLAGTVSSVNDTSVIKCTDSASNGADVLFSNCYLKSDSTGSGTASIWQTSANTRIWDEFNTTSSYDTDFAGAGTHIKPSGVIVN